MPVILFAAVPVGLLIFLDFDGVLRREAAPLYRFEKPLRSAFEDAVRRIPGAEIVVTSTWREVAGLTDLRKPFSRDVAERIVGVTPIGDGGRYHEILTHLRATGAEGRRFVVVDDDPQSFPLGVPLLLVDPSEGVRCGGGGKAGGDCGRIEPLGAEKGPPLTERPLGA